MTELTREKLNKILEEHKHWINEDCKNWEDMRADLQYADLSGADFRSANLYEANLRCADLRCADLSGANLCDANLRGTDLRCADLRGADLRRANLYGAFLLNADLSGADFRSANLLNADLSGADLHNADLRGADLCDADLRSAKNVPYIPMVCPEEGDFIGWKKAESNKNKVIVKLHIPFDAKRSSATTRKCRCSKAEGYKQKCRRINNISILWS